MPFLSRWEAMFEAYFADMCINVFLPTAQMDEWLWSTRTPIADCGNFMIIFLQILLCTLVKTFGNISKFPTCQNG